MSEQTETTIVKVHDTFANVLSTVEPQPVRDMIVNKLDETLKLINDSNARVLRIQESKNTDPNSTEYQDATWRRVAAENSDPEIVRLEARYQKAVQQAEDMLKKLREMSAGHMQPALSEDEIKKEKAAFNEGKSVIETSVISAKTMAEMADQMLALSGNPIEGGVMSLMPNVESLLNARGRKGASGKTRSTDGYALRIGTASVDGANVEKNDKVTWQILADHISSKFNGKNFPQNAVTALEIEEAFFKAAGIEWRDKSNVPDALEFTFSKDIAVQNTNDDGVTMIPQTVKIGFTKWVKPEESSNEAPANEPANEGESAPANA